MIVIKFLLILSFIFVFVQDFKERRVYWFLFPLIGLFCAILHYNNTLPELFFLAVALNLGFILTLLIIMFIYTKLKLRLPLSKTFGLGDLLLFFALVFSFSTITFIMTFIFSLILSLVLHLVLKSSFKNKTVPLAGYMSLFFLITYSAYWLGIIDSVYSI